MCGEVVGAERTAVTGIPGEGNIAAAGCAQTDVWVRYMR